MKARPALVLSLILTFPLRAAVLPPDAVVDGLTIGEWTAEWWKWVLPISISHNPQLDPDGSFANIGQPEGNVFFVAGTPGLSADTVRRTFTVPEGKYLLVPVLILEGNNIGSDPPLPVEELQDLLASLIINPIELHASIDGEPVPDLLAHRAISPIFAVDYANADNIDSFSTGQTIIGMVDPCLADGYWLMIEPLPPGPHVLNFGGRYTIPSWFPNDIVANITVLSASPEQRVTELLQQLEATDLPARRKQPLRVSLQAARRSFAAHNLGAGLHQLRAFQNKLRAQVARNDPALAQELSRAAQEIIEQAQGLGVNGPDHQERGRP